MDSSSADVWFDVQFRAQLIPGKPRAVRSPRTLWIHRLRSLGLLLAVHHCTHESTQENSSVVPANGQHRSDQCHWQRVISQCWVSESLTTDSLPITVLDKIEALDSRVMSPILPADVRFIPDPTVTRR